jgi:hypothetical protein
MSALQQFIRDHLAQAKACRQMAVELGAGPAKVRWLELARFEEKCAELLIEEQTAEYKDGQI